MNKDFWMGTTMFLLILLLIVTGSYVKKRTYLDIAQEQIGLVLTEWGLTLQYLETCQSKWQNTLALYKSCVTRKMPRPEKNHNAIALRVTDMKIALCK